jgi:hypothetical protein
MEDGGCMQKGYWLLSPLILFLLVSLACNAPGSGGMSLNATEVIETVVARAATLAIATSGLPNPPARPVDTPIPTATLLPSDTPTPQDPLVLRATLCWVGPGTQYDVVSALKEGERVPLLGKGSIPDWWIVRNPIYRDPCWVQARDLQVDAGVDGGALQVYYPPPTPTYTPTETPLPTPTNTP